MATTDRPRAVDAILPVTPAAAVSDPDLLPPDLRTPSILNPMSPDELIARMDRHGVAQSIIPARKYGPRWGVSYDSVRDYVATHPQRLFATAGICPLERMDGVRRFAEAVTDYGFVGAHTYTSWSNTRIDDRLYYPYYAKAEELGVPFQIEVMSGKTRHSDGRPEYLDQVATDFPGLQLIALHTGYPWERELVGMAEFRSNVSIGCDAVLPSRWPTDILNFVRGTTMAGEMIPAAAVFSGVLRTPDRSIFGTNYLSMDIEKAFPEIDALGLPEDIRAKLLTENARRVFKLPAID